MRRILNNLIGLMFGFLIGAALMLSLVPRAHSEDLAADAPLPTTKPVAALYVLCKGEFDADGNKIVLYMIVKFANGDTAEFDSVHLHGLKDGDSSFAYAALAPSQTERVIPCPKKMTGA